MNGVQFSITPGTAEDLDILVTHRLKMWDEIRPDRKNYHPDFKKATKDWLSVKVKDSNFVSFIARTGDGKLAGSGCVLIKEDQPRPDRLVIGAPYLISMYTEPEYRSHGVASLIVQKAIDWAKGNGYDRMDLHGSPMGKSLYEKFGFRQTNEMRLLL